ncbi:hypothetical protein N658DRAFT_482560 [Parathielavia hyrcaniae]|uniref:Chromo domain-containing protein n=1 Tax=Parathielavia hyrcaniae TaxID=113614 RepID=A0AAN6QAV1_9PEZI|nr:hypothetical protein N658DRAFT_482560 [Parathielavia hyrcaniae]
MPRIVPTSAGFRLDTETEKRLLTQLRPLDASEIRERTRARSYLPTTALTGHEIINNAVQLQCLPTAQTTAQTPHKITSKRRHLIDIEVGGGLYWVKEGDAYQKCKRRLLRFWERRGGRENAIIEAGGAFTENTGCLIHQILAERSGGSKYFVEWVGYGSEHYSWEPKSEIPENFIFIGRPPMNGAITVNVILKVIRSRSGRSCDPSIKEEQSCCPAWQGSRSCLDSTRGRADTDPRGSIDDEGDGKTDRHADGGVVSFSCWWVKPRSTSQTETCLLEAMEGGNIDKRPSTAPELLTTFSHTSKDRAPGAQPRSGAKQAC